MLGLTAITSSQIDSRFNLLTGVLAGLCPAWRAARIEPAEALRR
ncbi:hypothetical protein OG898_15335 [Streptomyces sp. NBC_00193]|nr:MULTISPECIES: hypothetical protein [unclassified Streptomyces]MCX5124663.1 hypothetical protein [Streptomyces sp. NBC_00347]MCX5297842.1 hypothetical protein [Streptomyces sp. NBC_00193]